MEGNVRNIMTNNLSIFAPYKVLNEVYNVESILDNAVQVR